MANSLFPILYFVPLFNLFEQQVKCPVINRETLEGTTYKYIQQTSERQISQLYAVKRNSLMALIKFSQLITDFRYFTV